MHTSHDQVGDSDETLQICFYLYSFEGVLTDEHWDEIDEYRKQQLKAKIGSQGDAPNVFGSGDL